MIHGFAFPIPRFTLTSRLDSPVWRRGSTALLLGLVGLGALYSTRPAVARAPELPALAADARAVVLFRKGELGFAGYHGDATRLRVHTRKQILKEEGKVFGEIEIPHGRAVRLIEFEGRTILPDGREVPLRRDAIFVERRSRADRSFVTKAVFPAVEVGAIIDFTYALEWKAVYQLEPWFFHDRLPTLYSEIVYLRPRRLALRPWGRETETGKIQARPSHETLYGTRLVFYAESLRAIPEEPHSIPFSDLSTHMMFFPRSFQALGIGIPIAEDWASVCRTFADEIARTRRRGDRARKLGQELTSGLADPRSRAERLFRFVRDEIRTSRDGILPEIESSDRILAEEIGNAAGKALLLQTLLDGAGIASQLVWARAKGSGRADLEVPNPFWFETALVRIAFDEEEIYLDPADPRLAFGRLRPAHEGTGALVHHRRDPELVILPSSEHSDNLESASLELRLDAAGNLSGSGEWLLTGHSAWLELDLEPDAREASRSWQERLEEVYDGFEVDLDALEEDRDASQIRLRYSLRQRAGTVLGDEASLLPSRPVGPRVQPFTLGHEDRKTPVSFDFPRREEVRLRVSWAEGWEIDVMPDAGAFENELGALAVGIAADHEARHVTYLHRFDLHALEVPWSQYPEIQLLFELLEKSDAQDLAFYRR